MNTEFIGKLAKIQQDLDAPKSQWNKFSSFYYRSCEDILEGLKPLLNGLVLTMSDDVTLVGDRIYVKATVTLTDGVNTISNSALARESLTKKGMDDSQITGTASSYARKYALNGMFLIDDTKEIDSMPVKKALPKFGGTAAKEHLALKTPLATLKGLFELTKVQADKYSEMLKDAK
jgi:hypothetical protein